MDAMTVAIDLAKDVFEVAMSSTRGVICQRHRFTRRQFSTFVEMLAPGTAVVMEACGSAHYWGRRCQERGAIVRLLPPQYVRAYVRGNKTDRTDAEALLEAHRCSGIHAVPVKTIEQQMIQAMHRLRAQWQKTRTARINFIRALFREQGIVCATGARRLASRAAALIGDAEVPLAEVSRAMVRGLLDELQTIEQQLKQLDRGLAQIAKTNAAARRLLQIPGIGVITATALVGTVPHIAAFRRGRQFASWLGLTPREYASGHRHTLGGITKRGDVYVRTLLVHGARSVLQAALQRHRQDRRPLTRFEDWTLRVAERRGRNRSTIAVANKLARIIWAVWTRQEDFVAQPMVP